MSRLLLLTLGLGVVACHPARRQQPQQDIVRNVKFQGNGGFLSGQNDLKLRQEIEQGDSPFGVLTWPLIYVIPPEYLTDTATLQRDAYRLEIYYAHNGWFDAQFRGWMIEEVRKARRHRSRVIDIVGIVDPGEASLMRKIIVNGMDSAGLKILKNNVLRTGDLIEGSQFSLEYTYGTRDTLIETLHDNSYAYADVEARIDAFPDDKSVDVNFDVEPGISATFGRIRIVGNDRVKRRYIRQTLPFKKGDPYKISELRDAQKRLFELGTFSIVTVSPNLKDPTREAVPVEVNVSETKFKTLRAGGGVEFQNTLVSPRLSGTFKHVNVFRQLIQFNAGVSAGVAYDLTDLSDADFDSQNLTPTYELSTSATHPRFFGPHNTIHAEAKTSQALQSAQFPFVNNTIDFQYQRRFSFYEADDFRWKIGPHWESFRYLDLFEDGEVVPAEIEFQGDRRFSFVSVDTGVTFDTRNDPVFTQRGSYWVLNLRQSLPVTLEDYFFFSATGEIRYFTPLKFSSKAREFPLTWGQRLHGRIVVPLGDSEVPYNERAFLGGSNSVRGFRLDQVGGYEVLCTYVEDRVPRITTVNPLDEAIIETVDPKFRAHGGLVGLGGTEEARYDWNYGLSFATFVDLGLLATDFSQLAEQHVNLLRGGAGVGFRYDSPVGPVRFDVAVRPLFTEDRVGAIARPGREDRVGGGYYGCRAGDIPVRAIDFFSGRLENREERLEERLPIGINIYLSIGEAF